ncbi:MAG: S41 family peptidase [Bacteroidota bacterium]
MLFLLTLISISAQQIDWKKYIEHLRKGLPACHINLFAVKDSLAFNKGLEKIEVQCEKHTDFEIAVMLQQLIAGFGDSHTSVQWYEMADTNQIIPVKIYWFKEGLYILQTTVSNEKVLGKKVIAINDMPVRQVCDSLMTLVTADNNAIIKSLIPRLMIYGELYRHFGNSADANVVFTVIDENGDSIKTEIVSETISDANRVSFKPDSVSFNWQHSSDFFSNRYSESDSIFYILYNKCWSREIEKKYGNKDLAKEMPSFKQFEASVLKDIKNKPVKKLIFDLSFNGGGNSAPGSAFIKKLSAIEKVNRTGKLYVVIGRYTFSSAIINAMDFKENTHAIFVGEETGGKPNHFGEVRCLTLPASGMNVCYSTKYFKHTEEDLNTIHPDVYIEASFQDFKKGIDPVYEWIKEN